MIRKLTTLALAAAIVAAPLAASAQQNRNCGPRTAVVERLAERYGESRQSIGMATQGRVVEVFASLETGTWTITVTAPSGLTCLIASGQSFENLDEPVQPAGIQG